MIDSFDYPGNSCLLEMGLKSVWISERIILPPVLINSAGFWSIPGDLLLLSFSIAIWKSKALGSATSGSVACISFCLTSLTPSSFSSWEKWFLHLVKILSVSNQIILSFRYCISCRMLTFLEVVYAPLQVSDFFYLTVSFKLINFCFQIFLVFVSEMSRSFTSYIV